MQEQIISQLLDEFDVVRYVALYLKGQLQMRQKSNVDNSSANESDKLRGITGKPGFA